MAASKFAGLSNRELWDRYYSLSRGANDYHNAGSQRAVDMDGKGALEAFALRDELQVKAQEVRAELRRRGEY